jgi:hypothetical protein
MRMGNIFHFFKEKNTWIDQRDEIVSLYIDANATAWLLKEYIDTSIEKLKDFLHLEENHFTDERVLREFFKIEESLNEDIGRIFNSFEPIIKEKKELFKILLKVRTKEKDLIKKDSVIKKQKHELLISFVELREKVGYTEAEETKKNPLSLINLTQQTISSYKAQFGFNNFDNKEYQKLLVSLEKYVMKYLDLSNELKKWIEELR